MKEFKVKFRGVRGSHPRANKDYMKFGGNTSCVELHVNGHLIILDAGTGMIELGNELMQKYLVSGNDENSRKPVEATILLSHIHLDHILGFTFFSPAHLPSSNLHVFGASDYNDELADGLADILFSKSFPLDLGDIAANLNISNITEHNAIILRHGSDPIVLRVEKPEDIKLAEDDVLITCYKSLAHPQEGVMIYKIQYSGKTLVYATDKETYFGGDKKLTKFARNCDLLIHDAQYTTEDYLNPYHPKQGYGHSTFDMALECQNYSNAKHLIFYHYDPSYNDEKLDSLSSFYGNMADKASFAYEGMEIDL
ncbi:MBL fold metallo-hydrolase [bacterium]|nr:MBL fold metallo-hydrolase [bacterium]